jgi:hypothetical protein
MNALAGTLVTPSGILISLKLLHPRNAFFPILVTLSGMVTRLNGIPFVPQKFRNFPAILEHRKIQANPL